MHRVIGNGRFTQWVMVATAHHARLSAPTASLHLLNQLSIDTQSVEINASRAARCIRSSRWKRMSFDHSVFIAPSASWRWKEEFLFVRDRLRKCQYVRH
jgi:hypothetical protein